MKKWLWRVFGVGVLMVTCVPAAQAQGADVTRSIDRQSLVERLSSRDAAAFARLSSAQQERTLRIVSDPDFGVPGKEAVITSKYPEARVDTESSADTTVSLLASGTRNSWVRQNWTVLFLTYATVRTDAQYQYSGSRAYSIDHCLGSYTNLVVGRQISYYPTYTNNSDGTITCRTNWTIIKAGLTEDAGAQGFRVNGDGTFIRKWLLS